MRFAAYAGTSMVLAMGVIIRALHQRANFYSACVYLAQSNACLMVLTNIALLGVGTGMLGLQRVFYGPLRPIEVEQLYEKAWFAITETCLAMTIFREEVGGWFLVMFVCLLIGKVWGWIGEGRVEVLEQQPPSNPRLFHARLSVSLMISTLFDIFMLRYSIDTVLRHARPNMMVMFAFEFAVLTVTSLSTAARYAISLHEASIFRSQISNRRAQLRRERESTQNQTAATDSVSTENDIDSLDIDVPGWDEKGRWVFYLDLTTDFLKLVLYLSFFCVLCMFYGMPIHIIRDVALTIRSFYKRITDFVRYRQATRDMNARYPDATSEEVAREDVCIICREDMRPWRQENGLVNQRAPNPGADGGMLTPVDERLRPKKLPCGHILHFACLRSWLERQQNCPTCRRPVLVTGTVGRVQGHGPAPQQRRNHDLPNQAQAQFAAHGNPQQPIVAQNVFNLGPLRIAFGARQGIQALPQQAIHNPPAPTPQGSVATAVQVPQVRSTFGVQRQVPGSHNRASVTTSTTGLQSQLLQIEQQLAREIDGLRIQQNQLHLVRALQGELARLRLVQATPESRSFETLPQTAQLGQSFTSIPQRHGFGHGHPSLPLGMTIPPGWTVLPLQRLPDGTGANFGEAGNAGASGAQPQSQGVNASVESTSSDAIASQTISTRNPQSFSRLPGTEGGDDPTSYRAANVASLPETSASRAATLEENEHSTTNDEVQHNRGQEFAAGIEQQRELPYWTFSRQQELENGGSSKLSAPTTGDGTSGQGDAVSDPSTDMRQLKGKGKATTIEDTTEDTV